jgi:hypothetical protein
MGTLPIQSQAHSAKHYSPGHNARTLSRMCHVSVTTLATSHPHVAPLPARAASPPRIALPRPARPGCSSGACPRPPERQTSLCSQQQSQIRVPHLQNSSRGPPAQGSMCLQGSSACFRRQSANRTQPASGCGTALSSGTRCLQQKRMPGRSMQLAALRHNTPALAATGTATHPLFPMTTSRLCSALWPSHESGQAHAGVRAALLTCYAAKHGWPHTGTSA